MGMRIITQNTVLDLHSLGIKETDMLYIMCIGGGGGGGGGGASNLSNAGSAGYNATVTNNIYYSGGLGFGAGGRGGTGGYNSKYVQNGAGGAGGGAGGFAYKQILMCQYNGSWTIPITIGQGGIGGAGGTGTSASGKKGTNGGTTSFGNIVSALGGEGGNGGVGGSSSTSFARGVRGTLGFTSGSGGAPTTQSTTGGGGAGGYVPGSIIQFGSGGSVYSNNYGVSGTPSFYGGATSYIRNINNTKSAIECIPGQGAVILFW